MNLKSGYPFWLIKHGLPYDYPQLSKSIKADVAIIGGGISGALSAYYLTKKGIEGVVIDSRTIGLGSTCASTSLLLYEIDTTLSKLIHSIGSRNAIRAYEAGREAIYKLEKIARKLKVEEFERKSSLYFAAFQKDETSLRQEFLTRKKTGFDVSWLDAPSIHSTYGFTAPGAILSRDGAQTNAYLFTHALLRHAMKKGMHVFDRSPVKAISHHKRGVDLKMENGCLVRARKLIYATGYEVTRYIDKKVVDLHSTYVIISEHLDDSRHFWKDNVMIWNTARPYLYLRTTPDNRIMVGGRDEPFIGPRKTERVLPEKARQLEKDFRKIFPHIPFKSEFSWSGTFGSTKDGLPFIGPYRRLSNSYFSLGFGGNGVTFSLIGAEIITDLLAGKKNKDLTIFSFDRL